ncbi:universal stress protein [Mangrovimonas sp. CR14]|uniref:universal stress protein n=1 Tax=Mangrovimonas sp. CR14 TaxID=2706120 RepID=UPI00141FE89E|nr:universal stress protein [Mangrovimonas sp. CR14]NIK92832.1 universal stress protein [Mangrovimonas sp. CR14]
MNKIIVPIDFSDYSEYALQAAASLAKKNDAEILALHMLELSDFMLTISGSALDEQTVFYLKMAEKKFHEFLDKPYLEGVEVTPIVKHFKSFVEVSEIAKEHNADLIVMGSHGTHGLQEMFVGSNTEKVVRHSEIPVLIIKEELKSVGFDNVVFACDFSDEAIPAYKKATKILSELGGQLHILYVNQPAERFRSSDEIENKLKEFLTKADGNTDNFKNVAITNAYTVEHGIFAYADKTSADLLAVATYGRTGIAHFFEGSISEDVANHAKLPVLTFKI